MEKSPAVISRQLKLGIAMVGGLLVTFSSLLAWRLMWRSSDELLDVVGAAPPATLIQPESSPAPDGVTPIPVGDGASQASADPDPQARNPFRRRGAIAQAAYDPGDEPAEESGRRHRFVRGQNAPVNDPNAAPLDASLGAGAAPATLNGAPGGDAPLGAVPIGAAPIPGQAIDPNNPASPGAVAVDPGASAGVQPSNNFAPPGSAMPGSGVPADGFVPNDNAAPINTGAGPDAGAAPAFVDPGAVLAAGQEPRDGDPRFARRDRFRDPRAGDPSAMAADPNAARQGGGPPGASNAPAYGAPAGYGSPGAFNQPAYDPAAPQAEPGKYRVQPNDNYWTICEKVYGAGAFFKALERFNASNQQQSLRLQVGDVIQVPPTTVLRQQFPDLCPKPRREQAASQIQPVTAAARQRMGAPVYVVEQGDTLFDIARRRLGKASRWVEIYDLNRDALGDDFDYLKPGTELVMPSDRRQTQDTITRQPADSLQR